MHTMQVNARNTGSSRPQQQQQHGSLAMASAPVDRFLSARTTTSHECEDGHADTASDDCSLCASGPCEACPYCSDSCGDDSCKICLHKTCLAMTPTCPPKGQSEPTFTLCQVRRHCTEKSVWIVAGKDIYDVTAYIDRHPAGRECILRKAGGCRDCADDLKFHSKAGQRGWKKYRVGTLVPCPGHPVEKEEEKPWWLFWGK